MPNDTHAELDLTALPKPDVYKLLTSTVVPRPIAWITTMDAEDRVNAAPFSFFNVISADPPLVAVGFSAAPDRDEKDTLHNVRATGELVVNLVSEELAEAMNITATDAPRGLDELDLAGLATVASSHVKPPRIAASPVSLECRTFQVIETGGTNTVLLARVLTMHVRHDVFENEERLYVNASKLKAIGRMPGLGGYCTTRDLFQIRRIPWVEMKDRSVR